MDFAPLTEDSASATQDFNLPQPSDGNDVLLGGMSGDIDLGQPGGLSLLVGFADQKGA
ncbi:hypothetical protein D3C85_1898650 [compost metagenome]